MYNIESEAGVRKDAFFYVLQYNLVADSDPDKLIEVADKIADFILNGKKGK